MFLKYLTVKSNVAKIKNRIVPYFNSPEINLKRSVSDDEICGKRLCAMLSALEIRRLKTNDMEPKTNLVIITIFDVFLLYFVVVLFCIVLNLSNFN